jgi:hypothetical protein
MLARFRLLRLGGAFYVLGVAFAFPAGLGAAQSLPTARPQSEMSTSLSSNAVQP